MFFVVVFFCACVAPCHSHVPSAAIISDVSRRSGKMGCVVSRVAVMFQPASPCLLLLSLHRVMGTVPPPSLFFFLGGPTASWQRVRFAWRRVRSEESSTLSLREGRNLVMSQQTRGGQPLSLSSVLAVTHTYDTDDTISVATRLALSVQSPRQC